MSDPNVPAPTKPVKLCECGCGRVVSGRRKSIRFLPGHFSKTKRFKGIMAAVDPSLTRHVGSENGNWKGGRYLRRGYVCIQVGNAYRLEHRVVAEAKIGRRLRRGEVVHHINGIKTDNRPENLEVISGSREHMAQHWRDPEFRARLSGAEKGRRIREEIRAGKRNAPPHHSGSRNPSSKLTESQVEHIRRLYPQKTQCELAAMFGVSQSTISSIVLRKGWKAALAALEGGPT